MTRRVLLVGLAAERVDYSKWPQLDREKLEHAFEAVRASLDQAGFDAHWCLTDQGQTARTVLARDLERYRPEIVCIGAGVRQDPDLLELFEEMLALVHRLAPQAALCFNTLPFDTADAVRRAEARLVNPT